MSHDNHSSSYRTDEQLQAVLHETANWVIHGRAGFPLSYAESLDEAIEKSVGLAQSRAILAAISRLPMESIIVFSVQIDRLRKIMAGLEVQSVKGREYWTEAAN
jgi:hypothetical protein